MKLGQLLEYNMRNIFIKKSYTQCAGETIPRPNLFKKMKIKCISGSIVQSFIQFVFIICQVEDYWNILKLSSKPFAFTSDKAFSKNKKRSGTGIPASFSAWFSMKNISIVRLYELTKFDFLVTFNSWDIEQYVYSNFLLTRLWRHEFRN